MMPQGFIFCDSIISSAHGGKANKLLTAVQEDLSKTIHIAVCRAVGLIDKVCTGPLWRKLQESSMSAMKIGDFYCNMKEICGVKMPRVFWKAVRCSVMIL